MGESKQQWLNKYILASNNRFWKEEGKKIKEQGVRGVDMAKKESPRRECLEKEQGNILWSAGGCLAASLSHTHTHTHSAQLRLPVGRCC